MKAFLISIGDELLIGQVVNTNASWLAEQLHLLGIELTEIRTIQDEKAAISETIDHALLRHDIVISTGGLGPTRDDITKTVLAEYFDSPLVCDPETLKRVEFFFEERGLPVLEVNRQQAFVPGCCKVLPNLHGTAPGMLFTKENKIFVALPGVPYEMKALFSNELVPLLLQSFNLPYRYHKTIMTAGMGESMLAERIENWHNELPGEIKLAYLPQPGIVRLRLSTTGKSMQAAKKIVDLYADKLNDHIGDLIFGYDDISLEEVVGSELASRGLTLSVAESCTGGYLAHLITQVPGCSVYFDGGVVAYDNQMKHDLLKVDLEVLAREGAVSQAVVESMALGIQQIMKTDFALSVSGIAGPDGGTADKPVGTVWIGLAHPKGIVSRKYQFGSHRFRNIRRSALAALDLLRHYLMHV